MVENTDFNTDSIQGFIIYAWQKKQGSWAKNSYKTNKADTRGEGMVKLNGKKVLVRELTVQSVCEVEKFQMMALRGGSRRVDMKELKLVWTENWDLKVVVLEHI